MLHELINKLADAKEPSRALDAEIEVQVRRFEAYRVGISDEHRSHWEPFGGMGAVTDESGIRYHAPEYTRSLDAAVRLVPDGWEWMASNRAPKPRQGRAYINNKKPPSTGVGGLRSNPKYRGHEVTAATAAMAMCIVGLMTFTKKRRLI